MNTGVRRLGLALLTTLYAFGFIDRVVIALVAQNLKADLGISDLQIGLLAGTGFAIVNVFIGLPIARLAERWRRSWVVGLALLIGSAFTAACAATTTFTQLVILRLGMACGSAGTEAPAHSMISDMYEPARRTSALSLFMLGVPIASIIGSYAGGGIAQAYGWRATFLCLGLAGIAIALIATFALPEPARRSVPADNPRPASISSILKTLWRQPSLRHVVFGTALVTLGSFGVNTFLPAFLSRNYALGAGRAGLIFGLVTGIASAVGSLLGGYGSEWLARKNPRWLIGLPGVGLVVGAPILVIGITRVTLVGALPLILVGSCFFYMAMAPAIATLHGGLDSRSRATGSALFLLFVHTTGQGLGPPLAGFVSDQLAAWQYASAHYGAVCAGAAAIVPASKCAVASAFGIRYAIVLFSVVYLWASIHFGLGARSLPAVVPATPLKPAVAP